MGSSNRRRPRESVLEERLQRIDAVLFERAIGRVVFSDVDVRTWSYEHHPSISTARSRRPARIELWQVQTSRLPNATDLCVSCQLPSYHLVDHVACSAAFMQARCTRHEVRPELVPQGLSAVCECGRQFLDIRATTSRPLSRPDSPILSRRRTRYFFIAAHVS